MMTGLTSAASSPVRTRRSAVSTTALRMWHAYVSAFIAPTILFFGFSGALQILDWHEPHGAYRPSAVLSAIGNVHKNQSLHAPSHEAHAPADSHVAGTRSGGEAPPPERPASLSTQLLKGLFVLEALALIGTTLLGAWIGVTHPKHAGRFRILLAAGTILPVVLLLV